MTRKPKSLRRLKELPLVSICTPTFNRRPFIPSLITMVDSQDYPKDRIEWIVLDDGTDCVKDLLDGLPGVRYIRSEERMSIGKKRNILNRQAKGSIIVNMDDDDFYPSTRITHAVEMLIAHPSALCAGSGEMYSFMTSSQEVFKIGPFGKKQATPATFAFRRKLLDQTEFSDEAEVAEGEKFLKGYTIPFVQLEPKKTIIAISHPQQSYISEDNIRNGGVKSDFSLKALVKENHHVAFYSESLSQLLEDYPEGTLEHKPSLTEQVAILSKKMQENAAAAAEKDSQAMRDAKTNVSITLGDGKQHTLTNGEVEFLLRKQTKELAELREEIKNLQDRLKDAEDLDDNEPGISLEIDE